MSIALNYAAPFTGVCSAASALCFSVLICSNTYLNVALLFFSSRSAFLHIPQICGIRFCLRVAGNPLLRVLLVGVNTITLWFL